MVTLIVQLLKNGLALLKVINNSAHRYIFTIPAKKVVILDFEFNGVLLKRIELFSSHLKRLA